MVRVCTKAGESQSHLWYYKAAKLTLKVRRGCACWLMHTEKRRKILKAPFCRSKAQPRAARVVIEGAWGGAFQWIAFGCETKYQHHLNNHTRLGRFLRSLGEKAAADFWEALDLTRQAGWYGGEPDSADAHKALSLLEQIRLWATQ